MLCFASCAAIAMPKAAPLASLQAAGGSPAAVLEPRIPPIIWMFWSSWPDNAPTVVAAAVRRHRQHNPTWRVEVLSPNHTLIANGVFERPPPTIADDDWPHVADWYRLEALGKFGGVWLDATTIAFHSVEMWVDVASDAAYQGFTTPYCTEQAENWAFAAPVGSPFIAAWAHEFRRAHENQTSQNATWYVAEPATVAAMNRTCPLFEEWHGGSPEARAYFTQHYAWARVRVEHPSLKVQLASSTAPNGPYGVHDTCSVWIDGQQPPSVCNIHNEVPVSQDCCPLTSLTLVINSTNANTCVVDATLGLCAPPVEHYANTPFIKYSAKLLKDFMLPRYVAQGSWLATEIVAQGREELQRAQSLAASCPYARRGRVVFAWHKSGSTLMRDAIKEIDGVLNETYPSCFAHDAAALGIHYVNQGFDMTPYSEEPASRRVVALQPASSLVAQMARNPFEMVVSSYKYDTTQHVEEYWQDSSMAKRDDCALLPGAWRKRSYGSQEVDQLLMGMDFIGTVCKVAQLAWAGAYGSALPPPLANATHTETWFEYVSRVGEDEALTAEALLLVELNLADMAIVAGHIESRGAAHGRALCEQSIDDGTFDECHTFWEELLGWWEYPPALVPRLADAAANRTCAQSTNNANNPAGLASTNTTQQADRVARLRRIDAETLNHQLTTIASRVKCPLSARYRGNSSRI